MMYRLPVFGGGAIATGLSGGDECTIPDDLAASFSFSQLWIFFFPVSH
jgi:hypothetical protein